MNQQLESEEIINTPKMKFQNILVCSFALDVLAAPATTPSTSRSKTFWLCSTALDVPLAAPATTPSTSRSTKVKECKNTPKNGIILSFYSSSYNSIYKHFWLCSTALDVPLAAPATTPSTSNILVVLNCSGCTPSSSSYNSIYKNVKTHLKMTFWLCSTALDVPLAAPATTPSTSRSTTFWLCSTALDVPLAAPATTPSTSRSTTFWLCSTALDVPLAAPATTPSTSRSTWFIEVLNILVVLNCPGCTPSSSSYNSIYKKCHKHRTKHLGVLVGVLLRPIEVW
eukprot:maker-scaffold_114-snap-gene-0.20-mRNA-1 protein AED:0.64 eAED:0.91 QI:0/0/0/0.61/0/0/13/0/282